MLPYGELVMHKRGGAEFFGEYHELLETTTYISTRFPETVKTGEECAADPDTGLVPPECRYARFDGAKAKAVDRFLDLNGANIHQFELYQKFYVNDILTTLTDSIEDRVMDRVAKEIGIDGFLEDLGEISEYASYIGDISKGDYGRVKDKLQNDLGLTEEEIKAKLEEMKKQAEKVLAQVQEEMKKAAEASATQSEAAAEEGDTPEGEHYPLLDENIGDSYTFWAGWVPIIVEWGIGIKAGAYLRYYYNYGMVENTLTDGSQTIGATAGVGLTPYLYADGHIAAGLGADFEIIKVIIGIEGKVVFIDAEAPFTEVGNSRGSGGASVRRRPEASAEEQILLAPEFTEGDIAAKLYLGATLKPRMIILDASLYLLAGIEIEGLPPYTFEKEIANFPPLLDRDFGNILPIPMLELNLISLNQIMNAAK
mgnify:CR=1 FL=1